MKAILALILVTLGTGASAQSASRIPQDEWANAPREESAVVRKVGQRFADCVVRKNGEEAREFVLRFTSVKDGDRDGQRLVRKLADGDCLVDASQAFGAVWMSFPGDNMRYALADALFRLDLVDSPPLTSVSQVQQLAHPVLDEAEFQSKNCKPLKPKEAAQMAEKRGREQARIILSRFGECVVRSNPGAAYTLLRTQVLTPEENAAFAAIRSSLSDCIHDGQTITLDKTVVRGTVAYNYYRLARAPRVAAPADLRGARN